jgi:hypothetical protein
MPGSLRGIRRNTSKLSSGDETVLGYLEAHRAEMNQKLAEQQARMDERERLAIVAHKAEVDERRRDVSDLTAALNAAAEVARLDNANLARRVSGIRDWAAQDIAAVSARSANAEAALRTAVESTFTFRLRAFFRAIGDMVRGWFR